MSLWHFTDKKIKVGDIYKGYIVSKIEQKILPSVLVHNYIARYNKTYEEPEILQQCVQLIAIPQTLKGSI